MPASRARSMYPRPPTSAAKPMTRKPNRNMVARPGREVPMARAIPRAPAGEVRKSQTASSAAAVISARKITWSRNGVSGMRARTRSTMKSAPKTYGLIVGAVGAAYVATRMTGTAVRMLTRYRTAQDSRG